MPATAPLQMRLNSSRTTFFTKRVLPHIMAGWVLVVAAIEPFWRALHGLPPLSARYIGVVGPTVLFTVAAAYWAMRKDSSPLADEVLDAGDALVVRKGKQQERIALSDIKNANCVASLGSLGVTLSLRRPAVFGDSVSFQVPWGSADALIDRIDAARRER
jgi:hypothetical protein